MWYFREQPNLSQLRLVLWIEFEIMLDEVLE